MLLDKKNILENTVNITFETHINFYSVIKNKIVDLLQK